MTFGTRHAFTAAARDVIDRLDHVVSVGDVDQNDERIFLRDPNSEQAQEFLRSLNPDVFVSAAYGRILRSETLAIPTIGSINIHPSLLPRFRGSEAVRWALFEGEHEVGVTLHEMVESVDSGPILAQKALPVEGGERPVEIYAKLAELVPGLLERVLDSVDQTRRLDGRPQSGPASMRRKPARESDRLSIDWRQPADELIRRRNIFPENCNLPAGPWYIRFSGLQQTPRPPGTIVKRRFRTLDVIAGDQRMVRLEFARPLRAWAKLILSTLGLRNRRRPAA